MVICRALETDNLCSASSTWHRGWLAGWQPFRKAADRAGNVTGAENGRPFAVSDCISTTTTTTANDDWLAGLVGWLRPQFLPQFLPLDNRSLLQYSAACRKRSSVHGEQQQPTTQ